MRDKIDENAVLSLQTFQDAKKYWIDKLSPEINKASLPHDAAGLGSPLQKDFTVALDAALSQRLAEMSKGQDLAMYVILLSALKVVFYKYTGQKDVIIGSPVYARGEQSYRFNTFIPLRDTLDDGMRFSELLGLVKQTVAEGYKNQHYPLDKIAGLGNGKEESQPWFNIVLALESIHGQEKIELGAHNEITLSFLKTEESIKATITYDAGLFREDTVRRLAGHYLHILKQGVSDTGIMLGDMELVTEEEKSQLLYSFNDTTAGYPGDRTIHRLFEEQAEKSPDSFALIFGDTRCTYGELNARANRLARTLREKGVGRDSIVALLTERSIEMIVGILGILKAGGAYLPMDPAYPEERIQYMLEDSGAKALVMGDGQWVIGNGNPMTVIYLDDESLYQRDSSNLENVNTPSDLAYIIYTSGTTGKPKGVMIEHRNVVRLLFNDRMQFDFNCQDVWTLFHSYCFDFSVWEMYGALLYGGSLVIVPRSTAREPGEFLRLLKKERVTVLNQTPTAFQSLSNIETGLSEKELGIQYVIFGGEALKPVMLKAWKQKYPGTRLVNMYGITETTVHVTYKEITEREIETGISNIGKPIPTLTAYIMDKNLRLLPVGVPGELCVGGEGVGRGYLNRPELTAERFVQNPCKPGERLYRSGDLAKWLPDGDMEYLGRIDSQVKIRGHRIELGEIESVLLGHEAVKEAVALAREDGAGEKYICAYIVPERELTVTELREYLSGRLPWYMIPSYFISLDKMPMTSNGKVDRKSLPGPDVSMGTGEKYQAPETETEKRLAGVWRDVLKVEAPGVNDNFFVLGGDSIRAIDLINRINQELGVHIQMKDLYAHQTVKELAVRIGTMDAGELGSDLENGLRRIADIQRDILTDEAQAAQLPEDWEDFYPLSQIQQGMVFYSKLKPEEPIYHDQFIYILKFKDFNMEIYRQALRLLAQKHPILRTTFHLEQFNQAIQVVHRELEAEVFLEDISRRTKAEQESAIKGYMQDDLKNKFKFDNDLLWRMRVFALGGGNYSVILSFQHAVLDGWSVAVLNVELMEIYNELRHGHSCRVGKLKSSYRDYVAVNLSRKVSDKARSFWKETLEGYTRTKLPFNISGKRIGPAAGSKIYRRGLDKRLLETLENLARKHECSFKDICLSAHLYLLSIITTENDIVTGVVTHDRPVIEDSEKVMGCFLNTLPLRVRIEKGMKKTELFDRVREAMSRSKAHEMFLTDIAGVVGESGSATGNPIFDILFNFTDFHVLEGVQRPEPAGGTGYSLSLDASEMTNTLFDLEVSKTLDNFTMQIKYSPGYFMDEDIEMAFKLYVRILEKFADEGCETLAAEELISREERDWLLYGFNNTWRDYPRDKTMHQLFEEQAEKAPGNIALVCEDRTMTYGELNRLSNRLARLLSHRGVVSGDHVGLMAQRGFDMIIGMLGILKCGAAYVPIDPEYPAARKEYIADNAKISALLVDRDGGLAFDNTVRIDYGEMEQYPDSNLDLKKDTQDLAYVIYTSGSTGMPKGVMIEHHSAANLISWVNREFNVNEKDTLLFVTSMCFDLSVYDIFGMLAAGGKIVIAKKEQVQNPWELKELLRKERITFWDSVPTTMNYLVNTLEEDGEGYTQEDLRLVFMSGDWIPVKLPGRLKRFFPNTRVISLGGATEGTVWSIYYPVEKVDEWQTSIPYGRPMDNNCFYILDSEMKPVPRGVAGELYIGGVGVARGYINRPELTAERFVPDPFLSPITPAPLPMPPMMYRTGDLGRMLPDGNIEFLGRADHQVKIRGFRVELGEIENHLLKYEGIKEAVVVDRTDERGDKYLCAYITTAEETEVGALREYLSGVLPNYMLPSYFVRLEKIPLTPNGKIDRKSLPVPETGMDTGAEYEGPRNGTEEKLAEVWQEILGVKNIGINDNFFEIGGDSIKAMQIVTGLKKQGLKLEIRDLLQQQTIKKMSGCAVPYREKTNQEAVTGEFELIPTQKHFFRKTRTDINHWNLTVMLYKKDRFDEKLVEKVFKKIVEHHDALRIIFKLDGEKITQVNRGVDSQLFELRVMDFTGDKDDTTRMDDEIYALNSSMDLAKGPLVKLGLYKREDGDHLLLVIHHLVWDGLSMTVILEDFAAAYRQAANHEEIRLPDKTSSLKEWSRQIHIYANSRELLEEIPYWAEMEKKTVPLLPKDKFFGEDRRKHDEMKTVVLLSEKETKLLVNEANLKYDTNAKDMLLTAFGAAIKEWTGQDNVMVDYMIHGREDLFEGIDVTRTVGWFATQHPVILDMSRLHRLPCQIKSTRDMMRSVPGRGLGYETLRDITLPENKKALKFNLNPEILFNYFGDFDNSINTIFEDFSMSPLNKKVNESPNSERKYTLIIELAIVTGRLYVTVHYNKYQYYEHTMEGLVEGFKKNLLRLIDFCMKAEGNN